MKHILFLLLVTATFTACNNEEKQPQKLLRINLNGQNLEGNVERYEESSSTVDSTGASKADASIYISDFDKKGYQTFYVTKDPAGKLIEEVSFTRYESGQMKGFISKDGEGKQTLRWKITIDSNGKYNGATIFDSAGRVTSVWKDLTQNEYYQIPSGTEYNEDGSIKSSFAYTYDKGIYIGGWVKDSSGKEYFRDALTLNDKRDAIAETRTTVTKDITKTEKFTFQFDAYDEKGNWTQMTTYNEKGKPTKVTKRTFTYYKD